MNRETCFRCSKPKPSGAEVISHVPSHPVHQPPPQPTPPPPPACGTSAVGDILQPILNGDNKSSRSKSICFDFHKGRCSRGEACQYSHTYDSLLFKRTVGVKRPLASDYTSDLPVTSKPKLTHAPEIARGQNLTNRDPEAVAKTQVLQEAALTYFGAGGS